MLTFSDILSNFPLNVPFRKTQILAEFIRAIPRQADLACLPEWSAEAGISPGVSKLQVMGDCVCGQPLLFPVCQLPAKAPGAPWRGCGLFLLFSTINNVTLKMSKALS